ncbi:hypothetical protein GCM10009650_24270 [Nesterenkonia jeotgali]
MTNVGRSAREIQLEGLLDIPEFCGWCGTPVDGYEVCFGCKQISDSTSQSLLPDNIALLTYAIHGRQSATDVYRYKEAGKQSTVNESLSRMKILTNFFIYHHSGCFRHATGSTVDSITHVPSGKGRHPHPLETQIEQLFPPELRRVRLSPTKGPRTEGREETVDPKGHNVADGVEGSHVLLLEDTWVRGFSALSATAALKEAGADTVSLLVLARYLRPNFTATQTWLAQQERLTPYDPTFCPVTRSQTCPGG